MVTCFKVVLVLVLVEGDVHETSAQTVVRENEEERLECSVNLR